MIDRPVRVRFAPSPTGTLHLGNARTALFNWLVARRTGGTFVLRIEDTDTDRERQGAYEDIIDDLRWLGVEWDEGPVVGGPYGPYRQSERGERYREFAAALLERERAYRCFCSEDDLDRRRAEAKGAGGAGYDGHCLEIDSAESERRSRSEPYAIRFRTLDARLPAEHQVVHFRDVFRGVVQFPAKELGDGVLVRRDGRPTYNFAVVVDDATMAIDLVLRGDDHLSNTPRQVLIYEALGWAPPRFAHLPMVRGVDGERLSKRHGAVSIAEFRARGYPVEAVVNAVALLGWGPRGDDSPVLSPTELVERFELERVSLSPSIFDPAKLDWLGNQHLQRADRGRLARGVRERLLEAGRIPEPLPEGAGAWLDRAAEVVRPRLERFDQVDDLLHGVFFDGSLIDHEDAREVLVAGGAADVVRALAEQASYELPTDREGWGAFRKAVQRASGQKGRALFQPVRAALTGHLSGPDLDAIVPPIVEGNRLFPEQVASLEVRARRVLESIS